MDQYEIVFKGEVMPNLEPEQVATALARLFKTSPDKLTALFSGGAHTLKSGLDRDAAEKYRDTLKNAGAIVYLRREGVPARASSNRGTARSNNGLSVAPMLGNLVRDEERPCVQPVEVDTSGIELADNDDTPLQAPATSRSQPPDTSHISIAEAGADLNPDRPTPPAPPELNTDAISLAPADVERLVEPAPTPDYQVPDTSALAVEPEGEILKPHEKAATPEPPPITHDFDLYEED